MADIVTPAPCQQSRGQTWPIAAAVCLYTDRLVEATITFVPPRDTSPEPYRGA